MLISFEQLVKKTRPNVELPERLLCLDPGETTGWCVFEHTSLVRWGQERTVSLEEIQWSTIRSLITDVRPTHIICEDYRIYAHKLARHTFSPVMTLRVIGGIECLAYFNGIPIYYQMASTAKGFVNDDKLKAWGFYQAGMRHSRDAIRHGCYFLLFYNRGGEFNE